MLTEKIGALVTLSFWALPNVALKLNPFKYSREMNSDFAVSLAPLKCSLRSHFAKSHTLDAIGLGKFEKNLLAFLFFFRKTVIITFLKEGLNVLSSDYYS